MRSQLFPMIATLLLAATAGGAEEQDLRETVAAQVMLDRALFSPGEIDGVWGDNGKKALKAFQEAYDLEPDGKLSEETSAALVRISGTTESITTYLITKADLEGPYLTSLPKEMVELPPLPHLGYTSATEMLAERFHADPELLVKLNEDSTWEAGQKIRVPAVVGTLIRTKPKEQKAVRSGKDPHELMDDSDKDNEESDADNKDKKKPELDEEKDTDKEAEPKVEEPLDSGLPAGLKGGDELTVVVSKAGGHLKLQDKDGKVLFFAPVTTGSEHDPLPLGEWKIKGTERYPEYSYNPELFWDAKPDDEKAKIKAGPNNPVGVAWIDLSKDHYGLHGTPEPGKIGYTESHGCVRLTNWDVLRLADLVKPGTKVLFKE